MKQQPKDLFSKQAPSYAKFRPHYPESLYKWLFPFCKEKNMAWDCATGNGQVALRLSQTFKSVIGTDISASQLAHAPKNPKITYYIASAANSKIPPQSCDLISVAQALHWFDFTAFFKEVRRVANPDGILAVWGYSLFNSIPVIDQRVNYFYNQTLKGCWALERQHVEDKYGNINVPFNKIGENTFSYSVKMNLNNLIGYLKSWSAVQRFMELHQSNPIPRLQKELMSLWPNQREISVSFPIFIRVYDINSD